MAKNTSKGHGSYKPPDRQQKSPKGKNPLGRFAGGARMPKSPKANGASCAKK